MAQKSPDTRWLLNRKAGQVVFAAPCIMCNVSYTITCNVLLIFLCGNWIEPRFYCQGYNACLSINSPFFIVTKRLMAIFTKARLRRLSEARWIQSTDFHLSLWRFKYFPSFDFLVFQVAIFFHILLMKFCMSEDVVRYQSFSSVWSPVTKEWLGPGAMIFSRKNKKRKASQKLHLQNSVYN